MAGQTDLHGAVLDTQGWTGLYSGRETYAYESARVALSDPHLAYLVLEGREIGYDSGVMLEINEEDDIEAMVESKGILEACMGRET